MIAGKNDDRGATEFYDNLGFEICQVKVYQAQAKTPCENCQILKKSSTDAWTTKTNTSFLEFVYGFTAVQLQARIYRMFI